jgi:hypothetical protein
MIYQVPRPERDATLVSSAAPFTGAADAESQSSSASPNSSAE